MWSSNSDVFRHSWLKKKGSFSFHITITSITVVRCLEKVLFSVSMFIIRASCSYILLMSLCYLWINEPEWGWTTPKHTHCAPLLGSICSLSFSLHKEKKKNILLNKFRLLFKMNLNPMILNGEFAVTAKFSPEQKQEAELGVFTFERCPVVVRYCPLYIKSIIF